MNGVYYWIRPAKTEDLDAIVKIEKKEFPSKSNPWDANHFKYYIKNPHAIVLVAANEKIIFGKTVGMIYNGHVKKGLQILDLSINRKFKRCGIGTELLEFVELLGEHFGCEYSALNVTWDNKPAIKMYERLGYRFVDNGKDEIRRMKKEFYIN